MPVPEPGQRWGLFGGTFDPVHNGHVSLAQDAHIILGLNGVLFIPARNHPLKPGAVTTPFETRVEMLRQGLADQRDFRISTIEEDEQLSGYTVDTVRAIKRAHPGTDFVFIIGADNLSILHEWRDIPALLEEVMIVVGRRPGAPVELPGNLKSERFIMMDSRLIPVSASEIRAAAAIGNDDSWTALVPAAVANYIQRQGLYRA